MILAVQADAGAQVFPGHRIQSETVITPIRGSVLVGGKCYQRGDVRAQQAHSDMVTSVAGPEGVDLINLVADRRAMPQPSRQNGDTAPSLDAPVALRDELQAVFTP
jgi:hypothetical protein